MGGLLDAVKTLDVGEGKKSILQTDEERLWMIAAILVLSVRAGLASFVRSKPNRRSSKDVTLPKGLINLLVACEKQGLITINHRKLRQPSLLKH
jgi:hypothetical protein